MTYSKFLNHEESIIHETSTHYVFKLSVGHYEVREHSKSFTHSIIVGNFDQPDEDNDARERAIEMCNELSKNNFQNYLYE